MSSYKRETKHPVTGKWEVADWLDDYFGQHRYGVKFGDGEVYKADDYEWETRDLTPMTNTHEEKLRNVEGYDGFYKVNAEGDVFSFRKEANGTLMEPLKTKKGYLRAILSKHGKHVQKPIHRLVAKAFIPNPENKPQINHKNGIRSDNRVDNLEWVTSRENTIDGFQRGRKITDKQKASIRSGTQNYNKHRWIQQRIVEEMFAEYDDVFRWLMEKSGGSKYVLEKPYETFKEELRDRFSFLRSILKKHRGGLTGNGK